MGEKGVQMKIKKNYLGRGLNNLGNISLKTRLQMRQTRLTFTKLTKAGTNFEL